MTSYLWANPLGPSEGASTAPSETSATRTGLRQAEPALEAERPPVAVFPGGHVAVTPTRYRPSSVVTFCQRIPSFSSRVRLWSPCTQATGDGSHLTKGQSLPRT